MKNIIKKIDFNKYPNQKYPIPVSPCCSAELRAGLFGNEMYLGCEKCRKLWQVNKKDGLLGLVVARKNYQKKSKGGKAMTIKQNIAKVGSPTNLKPYSPKGENGQG